jgi:hypothetical protein
MTSVLLWIHRVTSSSFTLCSSEGPGQGTMADVLRAKHIRPDIFGEEEWRVVEALIAWLTPLICRERFIQEPKGLQRIPNRSVVRCLPQSGSTSPKCRYLTQEIPLALSIAIVTLLPSASASLRMAAILCLSCFRYLLRDGPCNPRAFSSARIT